MKNLSLLAPAVALFAAAGTASSQPRIVVTRVPVATPAHAIHVAGSFNAWNPDAPDAVLAPQPDGTYALTLPTAARGVIEYKFTLGSWKSVETASDGSGISNRAMTIPPSGAITVRDSIAGWNDSTKSDGTAARRSTASASVHILSDSFAIPQLGRSRRVWVYLPPDYASSKQRYPVLYMHDGQNVFDSRTSFAGEWGVDETLDSLHAIGGPDAIVIAVDNGGTHRMDEYNPWKNANASLGGGEGSAYVEFLVHTLKPYVDAHFRTLPDAAHTGIMGSSMGGLISLYAGLEYPSVFGRIGVFSCACWAGRPEIYSYARRAQPRMAQRFYFVAGGKETPDGSQGRDQGEMVDTLIAAGLKAGTSLKATVPSDGKHSEWFWRREFPAAYEWLFTDIRTPLSKPATKRR